MNKQFAEQRLKKITLIIQENGSVNVDDLADKFNVSGATIRSDLRKLKTQDYITRTHGGAIIKENSIFNEGLFDPEYTRRIKRNLEMKRKIGVYAANLINNNEIIILDDGTTTLQVAKSIPKEKKLTIITNGINICLELSDLMNSEIISIGGVFRRNDLSINGKLAEENSRRFHVDKAILGVSGISVKNGITGPDEAKVELKKAMIENCSELIIVADHSKIERISLLPICNIEKISILVTDNLTPHKFIEQITNAGVKVLIAE